MAKFKLADKFGYVSPFNKEWQERREKEKEKREIENIQRIKKGEDEPPAQLYFHTSTNLQRNKYYKLWSVIHKIAHQTPSSKAFEKAVFGQNKPDSNNRPYMVCYYLTTYKCRGLTRTWWSFSEFDKELGKNNQNYIVEEQYFARQEAWNLFKSTNNQQAIIGIALNASYLDELYQLVSDPNICPSPKNLRSALLNRIQSLIHEEIAHAIRIINGTSKAKQEEEHKDYHGEYSSSPSAEEIKNGRKDTIAYKVVLEIEEVLKNIDIEKELGI